MKLLIMGGTRFLGRHLVEAALGRGHEVTIFTRGRSNPELFPHVERLRGDRDGDLSALVGRRWDATIDTSGYVPRIVRASAELLRGAVAHYTFISSVSVYGTFEKVGIVEDDPVAPLPPEKEGTEEIDGETYGPLKALCEQEVMRVFPGAALVIRPGLIVGPHDPTDRFTYWPHRVARAGRPARGGQGVWGNDVLAPGGPGQPVQIIDARDLAEWDVRLVEARTAGTFNATGPDRPLTLGELLRTCQEVSGSGARLEWVDEAFLLERGVGYWSELPAVVPESEAQMRGMENVDCRRAYAAGLTFRPLAATVGDTLAWDATRPDDVPLRAGLTAEREAALLTAWRERGRAAAGSDAAR